MYVYTQDARSFSTLQDDFGLPTPTTTSVKELFGPYRAGVVEGFWSYDPKTMAWRRHLDTYQGDLPPAEELEATDIEAFREAAEYLQFLDRPRLPWHRNIVTRQEPFLYSGFLFQWLFIPELGRWELLNVGKHKKDRETVV